MDLENLIEIAKQMIKPYTYTAILLAVLLCASIACNIYLSTREMEVTMTADNHASRGSTIDQTNGDKQAKE